MALDEKSWECRAHSIEQEDNEISGKFVSWRLSHCAIEYNRFIGVLSDSRFYAPIFSRKALMVAW